MVHQQGVALAHVQTWNAFPGAPPLSGATIVHRGRGEFELNSPSRTQNFLLDSMSLYRYNNITMQSLDRNGSIPLVYQLGEAVRDKSVRGEYRLDEPIPTEEQLQKFYGVSRTTVRLALAKLVNEGAMRAVESTASD